MFGFFLGNEHKKYDVYNKPMYDRYFIVITSILLAIGMVVVYSSSIYVSQEKFGSSFHFIWRQFLFIFIGGLFSFFVIHIPIDKACSKGQTWGYLIMFILCLCPCIFGREINGAKRWISLGICNFQPSELLKLYWILFISGYLFRHSQTIATLKGFFMPYICLLPFIGLLVLQKDLGSIFVLITITFVLLFICGAKLSHVIGTVGIASLLGTIAIILEPYRIGRLVSFLDPWKEAFGKGFQLTMSLMAFGRGDLFGQGLGNSIIKLSYLPEPHTDFIVSIWAEETGLVGVCLVIVLELALILKSIFLGLECFASKQNKRIDQGAVALGIGCWFFVQTFVNVGAASGFLPTKGLTLPFISYGGSSILVMLVAVSILVRISFERRCAYARMVRTTQKHNKYLRNKKEKSEPNLDNSVENKDTDKSIK